MGCAPEGCSRCQPCTFAAPYLVSVSVKAALKQPWKNPTQITNSTQHPSQLWAFWPSIHPHNRQEMSFLALWSDRSYNLQLIICFVMLFLSFLPYLWHGEGQGQACSEFRYCFTAWHFALSAIKDWQFLNPFQNGTQSFYFLRSRIILSDVPATGNWIKLFVYQLIFELAGSADWRKQNTCFPAGAEHSDSTKLLFPDLAFPTGYSLCRED